MRKQSSLRVDTDVLGVCEYCELMIDYKSVNNLELCNACLVMMWTRLIMLTTAEFLSMKNELKKYKIYF